MKGILFTLPFSRDWPFDSRFDSEIPREWSLLKRPPEFVAVPPIRSKYESIKTNTNTQCIDATPRRAGQTEIAANKHIYLFSYGAMHIFLFLERGVKLWHYFIVILDFFWNQVRYLPSIFHRGLNFFGVHPVITAQIDRMHQHHYGESNCYS